MKKRTLRVLLCLGLFAMTLTSCANTNPYADDPRYPIYQLAVESGYTGTYEDWLESIKGEPGKDGTSMHTGHGAPSSDLGQVGDSYVDLDTWDFYVKYENGWVLEGNIKCGDATSTPDHEGTEGLEFYPLNDKECAVAVGTAKLLEDITIPSTYKNFKVTEILELGFQCSKAETIIIPDSVTSIGIGAFADCTSLASITLPFIGDGTTNNTHFGYIFGASSCFNNDYYVPASLKEVIISDACTSIGYAAFAGCTSLISITIPDTVTSIGEYAFNACTSLTNVYYKGTIEDWYNISFDSYHSNPMYYAQHLYMLNESNEWYEVTEIVIPDTVTKIGDCAFSGCTSLASIAIPDSVTSIGDYAFYDCSSLISVTIGSGVTSIGYAAFADCTSLTNVYYKGTIEDWCNISFDSYDSNPMYYAQHLYMLNESNEWYEVTEIVIPDTVTKIGDYQFCGFRNLTLVIIPDSVTSIGSFAFFDCSSLTSIAIPDSVTSIGIGAFSACRSLVSITIPDTVTSIGYAAFADCTSLASITLPFIGDGTTNNTHFGYIFGASDIVYHCDYVPTLLKEVIISDACTSIGSHAFAFCSSLTSIIIPDSVTTIGDSTFVGCYFLTIYCEATSEPTGWSLSWNDDNRPVYWGGQWEYDSNNKPTPII